jgi:hypothetical protein
VANGIDGANKKNKLKQKKETPKLVDFTYVGLLIQGMSSRGDCRNTQFNA